MSLHTGESVAAQVDNKLKELPFKSKFQELNITDPKVIIQAIQEIENNPNIDSAVLDTITILMDQYEQQHVLTSANTMQAWGQYGSFYKQFIQAIKSGTKSYAILAHEKDVMNEKEMTIETKVPVKGAVGNIGVEADFTTIISTKKIALTQLEDWTNPLLNITAEDEENGFKYVFMTRIDKQTMGDKMRSAIGLWDRSEKYIDNDLNLVFKRLHEYYN